MRIVPIWLLFLCILWKTQTYSAPVSTFDCINGASENNQKLRDSFAKSWDPLRIAFYTFNSTNNSYSNKNDKPSTYCQYSKPIFDQKLNLPQAAKSLSLTSGFVKANFSSHELNLATEVSSINKSAIINKECITSSMKRHPGNKGYICDYPNDSEPKAVSPTHQTVLKYYGTASGKTTQCVDRNMTDYVHFAVNSAIQCLSSSGPIDSKTIFRKINNESAFNPSVSSGGGIGIGQITSIATKEIIDPELGKGRYILEQIVNSNERACNGFKDVAKQDLAHSPSTEESNRCAWLSPGDGLARNLMYTIGYYLTMRDKYIIPALKKRAPNLALNNDLVNDLTSICYGAEGIKHAKVLLNKFRVNNKTNISKLREKIHNNSKYLSAIKAKMKEMICIKNGWDNNSPECKSHNLSKEELEGETCVINI